MNEISTEPTVDQRIELRLRDDHRLAITEMGLLETATHGREPATPYLTLTAYTALARGRARQLVGDLAGINDLAWEHGWEPTGEGGYSIALYPHGRSLTLA